MQTTGIADDDRAFPNPGDELRCSIYGESEHVNER